eukprot:NODE_2511_length_921_cov_294.339492.p5 GENE.NODE_2511_length_921_cov_294.339492~~NODE_2511_length_921_cov_294.339492.p5  ORF type:complete len:76 (+),score=5.20 NODE_2511_length_921_cov_294.339492:3-230(+)
MGDAFHGFLEKPKKRAHAPLPRADAPTADPGTERMRHRRGPMFRRPIQAQRWARRRRPARGGVSRISPWPQRDAE